MIGNIIILFILFIASFILGGVFGKSLAIRSEKPITHNLIEVRNNDTIYVLER